MTMEKQVSKETRALPSEVKPQKGEKNIQNREKFNLHKLFISGYEQRFLS